MSSPAVARLIAHDFVLPKSKSCPTLSRRKDSLVQKAVQELISTGQVAFVCTDAHTTYQGKIIQPERVKKLAKTQGYTVFQSQILVMIDDHIPPGTVFLQFTTRNPSQWCRK